MSHSAKPTREQYELAHRVMAEAWTHFCNDLHSFDTALGNAVTACGVPPDQVVHVIKLCVDSVKEATAIRERNLLETDFYRARVSIAGHAGKHI